MPASPLPDDPGFRLGYRPGLDGLRGVALVVVTLFHAQVPWIRAGHVGLTTFFVLSGFLITVLMLQEQRDVGTVHLGRFYARRGLRIYPALVVFVLAIGVYVQLSASAATARAQWLSGVSVLAGVGNLQHVMTRHPLLLLEHTWSIAVELQFYLLWPLVLLWAVRRGTSWRRIVTAMVTVSLVVLVVRGVWWHLATLPEDVGGSLASVRLAARELAFSRVYPRFLTGTDLRIDHLMIGCLVGIAAMRGHLDRLRPHRSRLVAASFVAAGYLVWFAATVDERWWGFMFAGGETLGAIAGAVIIVTCVVAADSPVPRALSARLFVWLGGISYGVYLWHVPLYRILRERAGDWPLWLRTAVGGLGAIALALLSYHLVERWALAQKRRFEPEPRRAETAADHAPVTIAG